MYYELYHNILTPYTLTQFEWRIRYLWKTILSADKFDKKMLRNVVVYAINIYGILMYFYRDFYAKIHLFF